MKFSFKPSFIFTEDKSSGLSFKEASTVAEFKIIQLEAIVIEHIESECIGDGSSKRLGKVKGEGGSTIFRLVEVAPTRFESACA